MRQFTSFSIGCVMAAAVGFAVDAGANPTQVTPSGGGFAGVYGNVPADQVEVLSTSSDIKSAALSGAPTKIWEALEHGEKIECLDCISAVAPLLYDGTSAKNREIAAWWLRRRIFGVFGSGEVYEGVITTLQTDTNPLRRSYAAYALGEFLAAPGIPVVAQALVSDSDAGVRAAAAFALGRLNDDGAGALTRALADSDQTVRITALGSASRINVFSGISSVAGLTTDSNADVRRRAVEVLDGLHAGDSVAAVAAVAQRDSDWRVRAAAVHALGTFRDASATGVLTTIAQSDASGIVRDLAHNALLML
jgi:HEAT repeat protein